MNRIISKAVLSVSPSAWDKISSVLKLQDRKAFLFSAEGGGCNGYNYSLVTLDNKEYTSWCDRKIPPRSITHDGASIMIDPLSEMLLLGTHIDYIKEDYSANVFESKFTFSQDKEKATSCGCGVSFSPKIAES